MVAASLTNPVIEAELSLLGSILLDPSTIYIVRDSIELSDISSELNRIILEKMYAISDDGRPIGLDTVYHDIFGDKRANEILEQNGGIHYITNLTSRLPSASNIEMYVKEIRTFSLQRRANEFSARLSALTRPGVVHSCEEIQEVFSNIASEISDFTVDPKLFPWVTAANAVSGMYDAMMDVSSNGVLSTGFIDLDRMMTGLRPGAVTIVAARTGMGKTVLGLNMFIHATLNLDAYAAYFSLEMNAAELMARIVSCVAGVNGDSIRQAKMTSNESNRLLAACEKITPSKMLFDDTANITVSMICDRAMRMHKQYGIKLLVIDYIQLVASEKKTNSREQEVADCSRKLKQLAKKLNIPIVCLAQLNRAADARPDHRPQISDLRESGGIEQDADNVLLIFREHYYDKTKDPNEAEIIIAKQRSGPTGSIKLRWDSSFSRFENTIDEDAYF